MKILSAAILLIALVWPGWVAAQELALQQPAASPDIASTKLIKVDLIVTDENDQAVNDIKAEDLELTVDGKPQKITYFARVEEPVIYSVLIDTSQSFAPFLAKALTAVRLLFESNRPNDETMLNRFISSDKIEVVVPYTSNKAELLNVTLDKFAPEGGVSAVLDAVYLTVEATAKHKPTDSDSRRAVVLISDGEDRASYYDSVKVMKLLREQNVQVFIIGIISKLDDQSGLIRQSPRIKAERLLTDIAKESGGRVFFPLSQEEVLEAANHIVHDLQSQYVVGFERNIQPGEKGFEKYKVKIARTSTRRKLRIFTRPGYWLTPPETKKKN